MHSRRTGKAKEIAKKTCAEVLASGTSKRPRGQETGMTLAVPGKGLLHAMQTQKGERLRSPNNEWEMPVLQEGYARA